MPVPHLHTSYVPPADSEIGEFTQKVLWSFDPGPDDGPEFADDLFPLFLAERRLARQAQILSPEQLDETNRALTMQGVSQNFLPTSLSRAVRSIWAGGNFVWVLGNLSTGSHPVSVGLVAASIVTNLGVTFGIEAKERLDDLIYAAATYAGPEDLRDAIVKHQELLIDAGDTLLVNVPDVVADFPGPVGNQPDHDFARVAYAGTLAVREGTRKWWINDPMAGEIIANCDRRLEALDAFLIKPRHVGESPRRPEEIETLPFFGLSSPASMAVAI